MRILHVYRTYFPHTQGGIEEAIRHICLSTQPHAVESRILCVGPSIRPRVVRRDEAVVYYSRQNLEIASCSISLEALAIFRRLLKWADVVHYHFPWPFADLLHFAARVHLPTVLTYHSDIVRQRLLARLYSPLMVRFLKSVDRIVCTSPNYLATSSVLGRFADHIDVVPIGLDPAPYPNVTKSCLDTVRTRYGEGFFLFVGGLRYYKSLHVLLDAVKGTPYRVVIAGSGPLETALKAQAKDLELTNVIFTGYVSNEIKIALINLSGCIVLPSSLRSEAFGVVLLEGAMYGKPLITTEIGTGTSYVNVDGETGLVVTPASPKALRVAMDQVHAHPDLARIMGRRARQRFDHLFSGRLMAERYAAIYSSLTTAERPSRQGRVTNDTGARASADSGNPS